MSVPGAPHHTHRDDECHRVRRPERRHDPLCNGDRAAFEHPTGVERLDRRRDQEQRPRCGTRGEPCGRWWACHRRRGAPSRTGRKRRPRFRPQGLLVLLMTIGAQALAVLVLAHLLAPLLYERTHGTFVDVDAVGWWIACGSAIRAMSNRQSAIGNWTERRTLFGATGVGRLVSAIGQSAIGIWTERTVGRRRLKAVDIRPSTLDLRQTRAADQWRQSAISNWRLDGRDGGLPKTFDLRRSTDPSGVDQCRATRVELETRNWLRAPPLPASPYSPLRGERRASYGLRRTPPSGGRDVPPTGFAVLPPPGIDGQRATGNG